MADDTEDRAADTTSDLVVVGVGASAGGLEAFQEFLAQIKPARPRAYVLIQHLDPDHESLLPELLSKRSKAPIIVVKHGMVIEPGRVYLIPPGAELTIGQRTFCLTPFATPRGLRRPIDVFFASMAADMGSRCACIVLSGTGSDGSAGCRAVKEAGGLVFVQDPKQAKYDGMPKSAIASNAVDLILPAGDMVDVLDDYFNRRSGLEPEIETDADFIERVSKHVRYRTGHDFSQYKKSTLIRRLARRMSIVGTDTPHDYLQKLIHDQAEAQRLLTDILINVTSFFRDPEMFETLRRVALPRIVHGRKADDEIRIWCPGCSTGQEPYSIAMLLEEELSRVATRPKVSIFATDIDPDALTVARAAVYPTTIVSEVPPELLDRYFNSVPQGYRIAPTLREMVRISQHSVIKDAPFSKLDLISCRNLLIYFENTLQEQSIKVFHYALKPGGYLFLGPSETLGSLLAQFSPVNPTDRIFVRGDEAAQSVNLPVLSPFVVAPQAPAPPMPADERGDYDQAVLARHTPPFVVVNESNEIVYSSGRTGRFLELAAGRTQVSVLSMAKASLRSPLRGLLAAAPHEAGRILLREFSGDLDDQPASLLLSVERMTDGNLLIVFQDRFDPVSDNPASSPTIQSNKVGDDRYVRELEDQLSNARQTIRTTVEELETSNEELKSSNEEMMSMNEELQSANEELSTINEELQNKIKELNTLADDQRNLNESTRIATLFLDSQLRIRTFTPETERFFRVVRHDIGRPFEDIVSNLAGDSIVEICRDVLATNIPVETERASREGDVTLLVRVNPYITKSTATEGVIITLTDISELSRYSRALEEARTAATLSLTEIEELYRVTPQAKALLDRDLRFLRANQLFADMSGLTIEDHIGKRAVEILPFMRETVRTAVQQVFDTGKPVTTPEVYGPPDATGSKPVWDIVWYPVRRDDEIYSVGVNVRDVTRFKVLEAEQRRLMRELQHRVKNMLANVLALVNRARRDQGDPKAALESLVSRIQSLSHTHNILTARNWSATSLFELLKPELSAVYGEDRFILRGPDVLLNARATLAISMAIHELATNAAKYGALSSNGGSLEVRWLRIDEGDGDRLVIHWTEQGGPVIGDHPKLGFGSQLVTSTIEGSLGGRYHFDFTPTGFRCSMSVPYDRATGEEGDVAADLERY